MGTVGIDGRDGGEREDAFVEGEGEDLRAIVEAFGAVDFPPDGDAPKALDVAVVFADAVAFALARVEDRERPGRLLGFRDFDELLVEGETDGRHEDARPPRREDVPVRQPDDVGGIFCNFGAVTSREISHRGRGRRYRSASPKTSE